MSVETKQTKTPAHETKPEKETGPRMPDVGLHVQDGEPDFNTSYMIVFRTPEIEDCTDLGWDDSVKPEDVPGIVARAYNGAIKVIMEEAGLERFHQVGQRNEPGEHGWETISMRPEIDVTKAELEALFPKIKARAKEIYKRW